MLTKLYKRILLREILFLAIIAMGFAIISSFLLYKSSLQSMAGTEKLTSYAIEIIARSEILEEQEPAKLQSLINQLTEIDGISYVFIIDPNFEVVAHTFSPLVPEDYSRYIDSRYSEFEVTERVGSLRLETLGEVLDVDSPIYSGIGGYVHVGLDRSFLFGNIRTALLWQGLVIVLSLTGCVIIAFFASKKFSEPLHNLIDYSKKVANRDFDARVSVHSGDELEELAIAMKQMQNDLKMHVYGIEYALSNLSAIFDQMVDGLVLIDEHGIVTLCNPVFAKMVHMKSTEDIKGKQVKGVLPKELEILLSRCQVGSEDSFSSDLEFSSGQHIKAISKCIFHQKKSSINGKVERKYLGTAILLRDITADMKLLQMKSEFVAMVSHELRTPLNAIIGFAQVISARFQGVHNKVTPLLGPKDLEGFNKIETNIGIIVQEGVRLGALLNDLLEVSKLEAGELKIEKTFVQAQEILERAKQSTSLLFKDKNIEFTQICEQGLPDIFVDENRIQQVIVNLISNAVKFTDEGYVRCSAKRIGGFVCFSVEDTGEGIDAKDQALIFERFKQADDSTKDFKSGFGLGLNICRKIVNLHKGEIWVESKINEGSTFAFSIPITS
ncbi:Histidine kinase [Chlamydiales bacterium SCGC AG-110-M15]|nr:Histidine kinase [Chlamydiales bacterium SCGC AG-110-M15]